MPNLLIYPKMISTDFFPSYPCPLENLHKSKVIEPYLLGSSIVPDCLQEVSDLWWAWNSLIGLLQKKRNAGYCKHLLESMCQALILIDFAFKTTSVSIQFKKNTAEKNLSLSK